MIAYLTGCLIFWRTCLLRGFASFLSGPKIKQLLRRIISDTRHFVVLFYYQEYKKISTFTY